MKNFLRITVCVLLVLTFAVTCASCSFLKSSKNEDTTAAQQNEDTKAQQTEDTKAQQTEEAKTSEVTSQNAGEKADPQQGSINLGDSSYKSESLGIGLKLNDEWTIQSPEELAALVGQTSIGESLKYAAVTYDFYATKGMSGSSVTVLFENMKKNYGRTYDEDEYLELAQVSVKSALESQGATVSKIETVTRSIDGKTFKGFYIELKMGGMDVYEYSLVKRCGDYLANISIGALSAEALDEILALFYAL